MFKRSVDQDSNRFVDHNIATQTWQRQPLPDPGAMNYAYETLALVALTPVGPGVGQLDYLRSVVGTVYAPQTVTLEGIPTTAGEIYSQPLYDQSIFGNVNRIN